MHSSDQQGDTLAIEVPRMLASIFGSWTIVFTRDYVTDGKRKIYYKDATKISYSAVLHSTNFIPDSQDYKFMVGSADQEILVEMSSAYYIGNAKRKDIWQQLVGIALHVIQPRIIENLMRRIFVNGEAVRIYGFELTREGYSRGKLFGGREQVLWTDAKTVPTTLRAGKVIILGGRYTKTEGFWEIPMEIPNAVVMPELMKACVNAASTISAHHHCHLEIEFLEAVYGVKKRVLLPGGDIVDVTVPAGIENGRALRLLGKGEPGKDGGQAGDAFIEIKIKPHPSFARKGLDICVDVPVSEHDITSGATIEVPTLNGSAKVRIPEGTVSGQILRLPSKGIKCTRSGSVGHQLVRILVTQETAYAWPASPPKNDDIEAEFRNVFFNTASADRERIISHWMKTKAVSRTEAMRLAVEDWRKDNCRYT